MYENFVLVGKNFFFLVFINEFVVVNDGDVIIFGVNFFFDKFFYNATYMRLN